MNGQVQAELPPIFERDLAVARKAGELMNAAVVSTPPNDSFPETQVSRSPFSQFFLQKLVLRHMGFDISLVDNARHISGQRLPDDVAVYTSFQDNQAVKDIENAYFKVEPLTRKILDYADNGHVFEQAFDQTYNQHQRLQQELAGLSPAEFEELLPRLFLTGTLSKFFRYGNDRSLVFSRFAIYERLRQDSHLPFSHAELFELSHQVIDSAIDSLPNKPMPTSLPGEKSSGLAEFKELQYQ